MTKLLNFRLSLQTKLWLSICAIVLFALLLITITSNSLISQTIHRKATASLEREIELIQYNLDTLTGKLDDFAVTFSLDRRIQSILKENPSAPVTAVDSYNVNRDLAKILTNLEGSSSTFAAIDIAFSDDNLAKINRFTTGALQDSLDIQALAETRSTRHPAWSGPLTVRSYSGLQENVYVIYKAVYDLDSPDYLGCVILYVDKKQIDQIFEIASSENVQYYLVKDNTVISNGQVADDILESEALFTRDSTGDEPIVARCGEWLAIRYPLDLYEWDILGTMPVSYLEAEVRYLSASTYGVSIAAIFLALMLASFLSRSIMKPVARLMYSVEQLPLENGTAPLTENEQLNNIVTSRDLDLMIDKTKQLVEQIYNNQKLRNTLQFQVMQAQIKPHFLYNALETASSMIHLEMYEEAFQYIQSLSTFYRLSLNSGDDIISLEDELCLTRCYLDIQKYRYYEYFDYSITVDRPYNDYRVPKLILQPLVENSIYHGCKNKASKGHISVMVYSQNGNVILIVCDNGVGISQDKIKKLLQRENRQDKEFSYGLSNIWGRIRIIYNGRAQLMIESEPDVCTKITLTLPRDGDAYDTCGTDR